MSSTTNTNTNTTTPPAQFICPLTHAIMRDPVVDPEGNSYERDAIVTWLQQRQESPITRTRLTEGDLAPNRALNDLIQQQFPSSTSGAASGAPTGTGSTASDTASDVDAGSASDAAHASTDAGTPATPDTVTVSIQRPSNYAPGDVVPVMATITAPAGTERDRAPTDICCVIDVSGSMGTNVKPPDSKEDSALTMLDLVKHATKTVIASLQPQDRLAIVAYSSKASVVCPLTAMNDAGKAKARTKLAELDEGGTTNLWDGLYTGMEQLRTGSSPDRHSAVMLLTDGCPNVEPPRGHLPMLRRYKDQYPDLRASVSTFGFGYSLDSPLLVDLANEGNGFYSFIPDAGMVGTAFVHCMSNILVAATQCDAVLSVEVCGGAEIMTGVVATSAAGDGADGGSRPCKTLHTSWGATVQLGSVQYGQTKNVVFNVRAPAAGGAGGSAVEEGLINATVRYGHRAHGPKPVTVEASSAFDDSDAVTRNHFRQQVAVAISDAIQAAGGKGARPTAPQLANATSIVTQLAAEIRSHPLGAGGDPYLTSLLQDLEGQVTEALSKQEFFVRWGCHYLPSLAMAHSLQQCSNFKDFGVQSYGGAVFEAIRDRADDIFCKLPPPEPSPQRVRAMQQMQARYGGGGGGGAARARARAAPVDMSMYHNRGGGCFTGDSLVLLQDGSSKRADEVCKGDVLATSMDRSGPGGAVLCVAKTHCLDGRSDLVRFDGGLALTKWHPVVDPGTGSWTFPVDLTAGTAPRARLCLDQDCDAVYSFALDAGHVAVINGIGCVCLGHGFRGKVVAHSYFGTRRVLDDLRAMPGWEVGLVDLAPGVLRSPATDRVIGLRSLAQMQEQEASRAQHGGPAFVKALQAMLQRGVQPVVCVARHSVDIAGQLELATSQ